MMSLADRVYIARRFQRSIRIDTDLGEASAIEGFVCPRSSTDVLLAMARHVAEVRQGAFTWTGPYGTGKSSLVVALSALLNGNAELRNKAVKIFGRETANAIWRKLPIGNRGWRILPVVGRRDHPVQVVGEAIDASGFAGPKSRIAWTEKRLIGCLNDLAARSPKSYGGLILFIDEMGKFLEAAAGEGTDIYLFQQLAEAASRSDGRLIVIGVLHQAFEEYAHRLSHQMRDEWAKIQGRFIDLAINAAGEEQIDLLSRAIESTHKPKKISSLTRTISRIARPEHAERDGGNGRLKDRPRGSGRGLSDCDSVKVRHQRQHHAAKSDKNGRCDDQGALCLGVVDESTGGRLGENGRDPANRHYHADAGFIPLLDGQEIDGEIGA